MYIPLLGYADFQAWMEKQYLTFQSNKILKEQVKAADQGKDLHKTSVELARLQVISSMHQSIESIISTMRFTTTGCAVSYDDIATLLVRDTQFKRLLSWIEDMNNDFTYTIDDSDFVGACNRYLVCRQGVIRKSKGISASELIMCTQDVSRQFEGLVQQAISQSITTTQSYGDEIFHNGTTQDSSFDILYDIEQINKVLYANPKRVPTNYLRGPPNYLSINDNQTIGSDTMIGYNKPSYQSSHISPSLLVPIKLYASNTVSLPHIDDAIKSIQASNKTPDESSISSSLQCFDPKPIINSPSGQEFKKALTKLNKEVLTLNEEKLIDEVLTTVSQPRGGDLPKGESTSWDPEIIQGLLESPTQDTSILQQRGGPGTGNNNPNPSNTSTGTCPINDTTIGEQFDLTSKKLTIMGCLKQCSTCQEGFFKKACYQGCLCSQFINDKEIIGGIAGTTFGAKLCLVPSTTPDIITPGTQALSIQEIIQQISAILAKLKESGQAIPSNKPSEFFAPTTKVGKLANLINFRINVTMSDQYRRSNPTITVQQAKQELLGDTQPTISKIHVQGLLEQQRHFEEFSTIHRDFRSRMTSVLNERSTIMKNFEQTQK
ncbi:MAG TPA: hypothetical protein PK048_01155 [Candidatus Absconditabacterales bacterium]|nr:hypothetical protein [Candidatus Absconditabacterales bacterium]